MLKNITGFFQTWSFFLAYWQFHLLKGRGVVVTTHPDGREKWEFYIGPYRWYWFEDEYP